MFNKIKNRLKWAFTTKLGLGITAVIWIILWAIVYRITNADWTYNIMSIGVVAVIGFVILLVLHGWIINPIRKFINKRKKR